MAYVFTEPNTKSRIQIGIQILPTWILTDTENISWSWSIRPLTFTKTWVDIIVLTIEKQLWQSMRAQNIGTQKIAVDKP